MKEIVKAFPASNDPLRISLAGISYCDGSYHITRNPSRITVIEYVVKGEGYITLNGAPVTVTADTVYILPRGTAQDYYSSAHDPWEKIFINVEGDLALTLLERYGLYGKHFFDGQGLKDIFLSVAEIVRREPRAENEDCRLEALFLEALSRLSRSDTRSEHSGEAVKLKDWLDNNIHRTVGNRELASVIYRSPDYCIKLFGREFGTTPYDYHINEKLRVARRLLRDTALPVSEIASRVGYHDPCYFSGLFRRKCGVSPRKYRNENRR